jgi:predicted ATPase
VIGREVPFELLEALANLPHADLTAALHHLLEAEFVFERAIARNPEYSFKHQLTHEVAYRSLLHEQAKILHGATLAAIERLYADQLPLHVDALVHHALRGDVWPKAVDYLRQAGAEAFARGSVAESLARYEQALTFAGRLDSAARKSGERSTCGWTCTSRSSSSARSRGSSRSTKNRSAWPAIWGIPRASPGCSIA